MNAFKTALHDLWNLIFPNVCLICNNILISGEQHICLGCFAQLPRTHFQQHNDNALEQKLFARFPFERASALFYFNTGSKIQQLIHEIKYNNNEKLAIYLGTVLASESVKIFESIDVIVPVPLSKKRQFERGYNQSALLAQGIAAQTGLIINEKLVMRVKNTESQTRKTKLERIANLSNAFEWHLPANYSEKHILLIDDVITTGATVESLILAAPKAAGLKFSVLCLAHAANS